MPQPSRRPSHGRSSKRRGEIGSNSDAKRKKDDDSILELKTENRARYYKFDIPQPPGDPKLLDLPIEKDRVHLKIDDSSIQDIGAPGLQLLHAKHPRSGLRRTARLPALNLREGVRVLSLDPYAFAASGDADLDEEDARLLAGKAKSLIPSGPLAGQVKAKVAPQGISSRRKVDFTSAPVNWIMNTTYITNDYTSSKPRKPLQGEGAERLPEAFLSSSAIEGSFEAVKKPSRHPTKAGLRPVKSQPIVPFANSHGDGTYLHVQMGAHASAKGTKAASLDDAILKSMAIDGESVVALMFPQEPEEGEETDQGGCYKCTDEYRFSVQRDTKNKSFAFLVNEDSVSYVDLNTRIDLLNFVAKGKHVKKELARIRRGKVIVKRGEAQEKATEP
mmetsp:Transcript_2857/g.6931  ORF Transcript_2857/g.6931 Transcript_2857/m.6931 type:complete len:389 (+) Transcript_2857:198-1364(+)